MKSNKKLFKIFLYFIIFCILMFIILGLLGIKNRTGYLTDFILNTERTLAVNNITNVNELGISSEEINEYIYTNENIINYVYNFKIRYYSKVFRNSDIYNVYPDIKNIINNNTFINQIQMQKDGSPFGQLISSKIIDMDKIDNINYKLKIKKENIYILSSIILLIIVSLYIIKYIKEIFLFINSKIEIIFKIYSYLFLIFFILTMLLAILGNIKRDCSISNLVLNESNSSDENYIYNFKMDVKNPFFNSNMIYKFTHYVFNNPDYIKIVEITNSIEGTGVLTSSKIIDNKEIDNISYVLNLRKKFAYILITMTYILLLILALRKINDKNALYILFISFIGFTLFLFNYWIYFPGQKEGDIIYMMFNAIKSSGYPTWHSVFIQIGLHILYTIFGYANYYMYLTILSFWYIGLSLIIISLFLKYKNKLFILLFLISFLDNIFFMNMWKLKDTFAIAFLWLSLSLIFFVMLVPLKNCKIKLLIKIISLVLLISSMLFRHNFIVTVYPIFIIFVWDFLKNKPINKKYILKFCSIMLFIAIILVSIYKFYPKLPLFYDDRDLASNLQFSFIAANIATLSNDDSFIPKEWYQENKNFDDLKNECTKFPYVLTLNLEVFNINKLDNSKEIAIKYILKYPSIFFKYTLSLIRKVWTLDLFYPISITYKPDFSFFKFYVFHLPTTIKAQFFYEYEEDFTNYNIREKIYNFFYDTLIHINVFWFIIISLILFIVSAIIIIKNKLYIVNEIIIFIFSTSFSSFATSVIVGFFVPAPEYRYIYPVVPITIISLIALSIFIYDNIMDKTKCNKKI